MLHPAKVITALALTVPTLSTAVCLPFTEAHKHIGETHCIVGKVLRVEAGSRGVHYLDFCEDYRLCPFSVVIFAYDLKNVGDVRQLEGREVEIQGELKEYDGRAEIILENASQLGGQAARIPPLPKSFVQPQCTQRKAAKDAERNSSGFLCVLCVFLCDLCGYKLFLNQSLT